MVGLIGAGIQGSLSPALHEREAAAHGVPYSYRRIDLDQLGLAAGDAPQLLAEARRSGFRGLNVTHPAKRSLGSSLDSMSPAARVLGAVNTVVFDNDQVRGFNTDHTGFRRNMEREHPTADLDRVVVLGAGGAGSAAAYALVEMGTAQLTIVDSDTRAAGTLQEALDGWGTRIVATAPDQLRDALADATGFVQATPVGMAAHPGQPVPSELLRQHHWMAELIYRPVETGLVRAARDAGCTVITGTGMAVFQAAESFELFTGLTADVSRMFTHMEELLDMETAR